MPAEKILIVDDDKNIVELIKLYLEKENYRTAEAYDGKEAVLKFRSEKPALVILDLMLPEMNGNQVCREITKNDNVPIIMLTAKGEIIDKMIGFELGADDYIVKPFDPRELVARVKAVLKRTVVVNAANDRIMECDNLKINMTNYELKISGKPIEMPPKELELLYYLASNPNRV
ncbi:MAG: response regulator transcription factor, partial [Oscillospiraceae bacterium]|nr:response regulator transcription factor [Oscillospiraceae bacterium]